MTPADVTEQMDALKEGFFEVLPQRIFRGFTPQQFERFIVGGAEIDIDDLHAHIIPEGGYNRQSDQVVWFMEMMRNLPDTDRRRVLRWITGGSQVPLGGFANLYPSRMRITRMIGASDLHLPRAHTCFNQIELPPYSTRDILRRKVMDAVDADPEMAMYIA